MRQFRLPLIALMLLPFAAIAARCKLADPDIADARRHWGSARRRKMYAVDISCNSKGDLHDASDAVTTRTRTLAFVLSTAPSTALPDGSSKLPDAALAAIQVFSVDKSATFVDRRDCEQHLLVTGDKRLYLIVALNVLNDYATSRRALFSPTS